MAGRAVDGLAPPLQSLLDQVLMMGPLSLPVSLTQDDDMGPEYDFASMKGGVRGEYVQRFRAGTNIVLLDPEVAEAFPSKASVNEALRGVLNTTRAIRRTGRLPNKALQPTSRATWRATFVPRRRAVRCLLFR